ncbi:hypothetical protein HYX11_02515 [Candidatus Woesearchaeota archaeon]|nr:hypothetical protein [Candidatus Woesearchaeota archaeon]
MKDNKVNYYVPGGLAVSALGSLGLVATEITNYCGALNFYQYQCTSTLSLSLTLAGLVYSIIPLDDIKSYDIRSNINNDNNKQNLLLRQQQSPLEKIIIE